MNYTIVLYVNSNKDFTANNIFIDGNLYYYDLIYGRTILQKSKDRDTRIIIPCVLPLNIENPKETIDQFFKLLLLN
jgi:hypothetical protein